MNRPVSLIRTVLWLDDKGNLRAVDSDTPSHRAVVLTYPAGASQEECKKMIEEFYQKFEIPYQK